MAPCVVEKCRQWNPAQDYRSKNTNVASGCIRVVLPFTNLGYSKGISLVREWNTKWSDFLARKLSRPVELSISWRRPGRSLYAQLSGLISKDNPNR